MNKQTKKKKNTLKRKILLFTLFFLLLILIIDKFTGNNITNYFFKIYNDYLINKNPDSLIISVQSNKENITTIPLITYNSIEINWGDGVIENFNSYKYTNKDNKNIFDDIIFPTHKYNKKGRYNIIITGDTKRGFLGFSNYTTTDNYGIKMFKKEFLNEIPEYIEEHIEEHITKEENSNTYTNNYTIINFKNLNFKGLGNLTEYIDNEINVSWLEEFKDLEVFIETFAYSNISVIPEDIFSLSPNLRILSATFLACEKLKSLPENLIVNLDKIENVRHCFSNCINLEGNAPNWWNTMNKIKDKSKVSNLPFLLCFNECKNLDNYNEIPFYWGGILREDN